MFGLTPDELQLTLAAGALVLAAIGVGLTLAKASKRRDELEKRLLGLPADDAERGS